MHHPSNSRASNPSGHPACKASMHQAIMHAGHPTAGHPSIRPSGMQGIHPSIRPSGMQGIHPSIRPSCMQGIHPSIRPSGIHGIHFHPCRNQPHLSSQIGLTSASPPGQFSSAVCTGRSRRPWPSGSMTSGRLWPPAAACRPVSSCLCTLSTLRLW